MRLLALGNPISETLGEAETDRDLALSIFLSALLRPACFSTGLSASSSKDEERGRGISSTSISVSDR